MVPKRRIELVGEGNLARKLLTCLPERVPEIAIERGTCSSPAPNGAARVLVARLDRVAELEPWLRQQSELLAIGVWRKLIFLGPFRSGPEPGCFACLVHRVSGTPDGPDLDASGVALGEPACADPVWSPWALGVVPELVALELEAWRRGSPPRSAAHVLVFDTQRGVLGRERLIPYASCPVCGGEPAPRLESFPDADVGRTRCDGRRLRSSDSDSIQRAIDGVYLNPTIGLVRETRVDLQSPFGTCYLDLPLKHQRAETCIGRGVSFTNAQSVAVLESLERYCGWHRGGPREVVTAPYSALAEQAIAPPSLGLHPDACYDLPGFPFARFDPELPVEWVWGYSIRRNTPIWVPARYAFYGHPKQALPAFVYEVSNGCALGSTLEEAVMHGLLELVERDSFLLTWYRKLSLPEISTADIPDRAVRYMLRRAELSTRSTVRLFLSTREHGIPSLFGVATGHTPNGPKTLCAASAHPDLVQALRSLLHELSGLTLRMQAILPERHADAVAMLERPELVRQMEDHALVNCLTEARQRFAFLLDCGREPLSFTTAMEQSGSALPDVVEVRQALSFLLERILGAGLDVIVVDHTMRELAAAGLRCAKVIVPGMLSMTFGHVYRRVDLPRLFAADAAAMADSAEIGALPHPFP